ncbi:hypothetical protein E2C01_031327 [Portunus trituberculatus]|uniref:Uncharacterized protein n=1 Tax=Portunus trituberculatus TaxID=210409 RepID=A0A5B7EY96_PORTR|nr:hypothetical protein [Portunus trituberculatus]
MVREGRGRLEPPVQDQCTVHHDISPVATPHTIVGTRKPPRQNYLLTVTDSLSGYHNPCVPDLHDSVLMITSSRHMKSIQ